MTADQYLNMQKTQYENAAVSWNLDNRDPVVGSYDAHNQWPDYDTYLFKDFDTTNLVALEYGCGPGRNLIKFNDRFSRIDGVDIADMNIQNARENLKHNNINNSNLYVCDGKSIPTEDGVYDVVFSVICLQHICCYDVRLNIMKEVKRVLKPNGYFCFQMGFGGRNFCIGANYYENNFLASETNGGQDVEITNEFDLSTDLLGNLGFKNYKSDIRETGPGDSHASWIWVQVQK